MSEFFNRLDLLRRQRKEALTDIAAFLHISGPAVHGWKKGGLPKPDKLRLLAEHYGVTVEWLLSGTGAAPPTAAHEPREGYSPPQPDHAKIAALEARLAEALAKYAEALAEKERLLKVIEDLATSIAGPRPVEQGRSEPAAPGAVPAAPASGVLYKTRRSKSA
jgi:transcriptional regulator with XRE-family HTH domain